MLGYLIDDFDRELHDFIIDPKMEREQEKATRQSEAFRRRFPLKELQKMPLEEFRDPRGRKDDFCHWITDGTSAVTNRLAWAKVKLGISGSRNYYGYQRNLRMAADWHERGRDSWLSLANFLRHYGLGSDGRAEHDFGQPLLLKLLYLYHPEDFINIANVGWIDNARASFQRNAGLFAIAREGCLSGLQRGS